MQSDDNGCHMGMKECHVIIAVVVILIMPTWSLAAFTCASSALSRCIVDPATFPALCREDAVCALAQRRQQRHAGPLSGPQNTA
jgi:hypothetical protein